MSSIYSTNKGLNTYDKQPNAGLLIRVGVTTRTRSTERWKQTQTTTEMFSLSTTLALYESVLDAYLTNIWAFAQLQRALPNTSDIRVHYTAQIENPTAPAVSKGSWVQKKQHFDGTFTDAEYSSSSVLSDKLIEIVELMKKHAKY